MALQSHFNGSKKRKLPLEDLKERASLVPSAKKELKRPYFVKPSLEEQKAIGDDLLDFCTKDTVLNIDEFFVYRNMPPSHFYRLCQENEYLSYCLDIALSRIGLRLEESIKNNQLYQIHNIKHYSSTFREEARLKREADKNTQVTKIYEVEKVGIPVFTAKKDKE